MSTMKTSIPDVRAKVAKPRAKRNRQFRNGTGNCGSGNCYTKWKYLPKCRKEKV